MFDNENSDKILWDKIFKTIPPFWKESQPQDSMYDCLTIFKKNNVKTVLDLGCGIGIWSTFLAKSGMEVKGVDFSGNAINHAKEWADEEKLKIAYDCGTLTNHSFLHEQFDAVLASKILDNISKKMFRASRIQILKNLNSGGVLFSLFSPFLKDRETKNLEKEDNPTKGITHINYSDSELRLLFPDLELLSFKYYNHGFRGLVWKKKQ